MNKIGTAHVLLSDSIHTLPIEEENDGRGGLCESWSATGVSSLSTTVLLLRLASASGKQIRDRGRRPGKRLRVQRRWTGSSAAYDIVDEADALRWMSALM